jgi:four helix bundle protein
VRRAAVSIPSNIAEGSGGAGIPEFRHGVSVAHGSLCELETQVQLGIDLEHCDPARGQAVLDQAAEVDRIIRGLLGSLERRKGGLSGD